MTTGSLAEYSQGVTDKDCYHRYCTLFYDQELAAFRDGAVELLEIGVGGGGSIAMWHRYFQRATRIVGVDCNLSPSWLDAYVATLESPPSNILLKQADAYSAGLSDELGYFDIIIDDGPHTLASHLLLLLFYLPKLKPGGILVIEDVPDISWIPAYERIVASMPAYAHRTIDLRGEYRQLSDDILFVVRHETSNSPTLEPIVPAKESSRSQIKRLLLDAGFDPACRVEGWRLPESPPEGALLFQTLTWGEYESFIPTYIYSVLTAYPECYARLIHQGPLSAAVREALFILHDKFPDHFEVLENVWPHTPWSMGMRWLLGGAWWQGFTYGHIGDADLLIYRESPTLLEFELDRARQLGKPFVNNTQIPNLCKMAGYSHFVICEPYFAALRPVQERFIDDPYRLLLRDADAALPTHVDPSGCAYQLCVPPSVGNDEFLLYHLIDESLGAPPILTPQPPWAVAHGIHLGALRYRQPWWRLVGGARPPEELEAAERMLADPLFRRIVAGLGPWLWQAADQLVADVVLERQRKMS